MIDVSLTAVLCSVALLIGVGGASELPTEAREVRRLVVLVPNCACVNSLVAGKVECDSESFSSCWKVSLSDGTPNSPKCNAIEDCAELVNCDAGVGAATVIPQCNDPKCQAVFASFEVLVDDLEVGTMTCGALGIIVPVGGSPVACTSADNSEGQGNKITVRTPATPNSYKCTIEIKDSCKKCGG